MVNFAEEFEKDAVVTPQVSDLDELQQLVTKQIALEDELIKVAEYIKSQEVELKKISEEMIPALFEKLNMEEFKLNTGQKVTVKQYYAANISAENQEKAFNWLKEQKLDDVIKHEVKVLFGRGEDEQAKIVKQALNEFNVNYTDKQHVHPQTLKALVKEQIESESSRLAEGYHFPRDLFSVFIGKKTKIEAPKKERRK